MNKKQTQNTVTEVKQGEKTDWSKRDIGALWKRESSTQKYLSGYVKIDELGIESEVKIIVFSNKNKKDNQKAPDYRIYLSKPTEKSQPAAKVSKQADVAEDTEDVL